MRKRFVILALVAFLVAVVILGLVLTRHKGGMDEEPQKRILAIDVTNFDRMGVSLRDFDACQIDPETGYRKGPRGRLLSPAMMCASCKQDIPSPAFPKDPLKRNYQWLNMEEYLCPRCKKPAFEEGLRPTGE